MQSWHRALIGRNIKFLTFRLNSAQIQSNSHFIAHFLYHKCVFSAHLSHPLSLSLFIHYFAHSLQLTKYFRCVKIYHRDRNITKGMIEMKKNRLLIVSADDPAAISLSETLSRYDDFEICAIAHDGLHALHLLSTIRPDIVLTDLLLPHLDGLCMIRQICAMPNPPIVICQSDFHSRDSCYFLFSCLNSKVCLS